ncbi:hypothetical protein [Nocardia mikamii]|uniref:hypothetical protein n=1 Tax=Nocardia mikamii TaxID=508464 RepID=UPI0012F51787|nr:hypothetical protein [Nocardia mikamii]
MINVVVEGESDKGVVSSVVRAAGHEIGKVIVRGGKAKIDPLIGKYNQAAARLPWVIFRDSDTHCPVELYKQLTDSVAPLSPLFLLRVVHPMSEGWLLADREGFAEYFNVRVAEVPRNPESLVHPKRTVLQLCSKSRSRSITRDMVALGERAGPRYVVRVNEFAASKWNVENAASNSESLRRALERIRSLPK